jgi:hypothetical protein
LVFPVGIEIAVFTALILIILPVPIEVGVIERFRVGELVGRVRERFHGCGVFFELGGGGDEWMRKHDRERIAPN